MKTNKSAEKRFKVTGSGKIVRRKVRQNHFNARQDSGHRRNKRMISILTPADSKKIKNIMRFSG